MCVCYFSQDLVNKFNSLVMPEVTNCIISEDPSFVEMLETIETIQLTMFPDMPLFEALRHIHEQLRQCALRNNPMDLSVTSAVEEMKHKLSIIMFPSEEEKGRSQGPTSMESCGC